MARASTSTAGVRVLPLPVPPNLHYSSGGHINVRWRRRDASTLSLAAALFTSAAPHHLLPLALLALASRSRMPDVCS